jgi:hypothetical protein
MNTQQQNNTTLPLEEQMFLNPATGRMVNYKGAIYRGLIDANSIPRVSRKQEVDETPIEVETIKMSDIKFDANIFKPIKTGNKNLDNFVSSEGGFMPATNVILIGTPGIGKSTVGLDFLVRAKSQGKRVLFISGEMQRIDMYRYCKRFPAFNDIDISWRLIPGSYNIGNWYRPFVTTFEMLTDEIKISRGQPLAYVKFRTPEIKDKVKLVKIDRTEHLEHVVNSSLTLKHYIPKISWKIHNSFNKLRPSTWFKNK